MRYFNTTSGPLAITFVSGASTLAMPQSWVDIPRSEEGSESILDHVQKGHLVRSKIDFDAIAEAAEKSQIAAAAIPVLVNTEISLDSEKVSPSPTRSKAR